MSGSVEITRALVLVWNTAQRDTGQSRVCLRLLLGMYNGSRFPFDLTDLRLLDSKLLDAALLLLRMDARPQMEVHDLLNRLYGRRDFGHRLELLACTWRFKGKCPTAMARDLQADKALQAPLLLQTPKTCADAVGEPS